MEDEDSRDRYTRRDRKREAERKRMRKHGRSLLTITQLEKQREVERKRKERRGRVNKARLSAAIQGMPPGVRKRSFAP